MVGMGFGDSKDTMRDGIEKNFKGGLTANPPYHLTNTYDYIDARDIVHLDDVVDASVRDLRLAMTYVENAMEKLRVNRSVRAFEDLERAKELLRRIIFGKKKDDKRPS